MILYDCLIFVTTTYGISSAHNIRSRTNTSIHQVCLCVWYVSSSSAHSYHMCEDSSEGILTWWWNGDNSDCSKFGFISSFLYKLSVFFSLSFSIYVFRSLFLSLAHSLPYFSFNRFTNGSFQNLKNHHTYTVQLSDKYSSKILIHFGNSVGIVFLSN